ALRLVIRKLIGLRSPTCSRATSSADLEMRIAMRHVRGFTILACAAFVLGLASTPVLAKHEDKSKQATEYPDSTREAPKLDLKSEKDQKHLQEGLDAINKGDMATAETTLQALVDGSKSKYAQAMALRGLALSNTTLATTRRRSRCCRRRWPTACCQTTTTSPLSTCWRSPSRPTGNIRRRWAPSRSGAPKARRKPPSPMRSRATTITG